MNLKMRCQNCSETKEVESKTGSALSRCDAAFKAGWTAVTDGHFQISYYCSRSCEMKHRTKNKRHLTLVK